MQKSFQLFCIFTLPAKSRSCVCQTIFFMHGYESSWKWKILPIQKHIHKSFLSSRLNIFYFIRHHTIKNDLFHFFQRGEPRSLGKFLIKCRQLFPADGHQIYL